MKNLYDDKAIIPGAGAFEIAANYALREYAQNVKGKEKLGIIAFAEAILIIPKVLAENSGFDIQDAIIKLQDEYNEKFKKEKKIIPVGLNIKELGIISPEMEGIIDNYCVKKQFLSMSPVLAEQLLLVDEVIYCN